MAVLAAALVGAAALGVGPVAWIAVALGVVTLAFGAGLLVGRRAPSELSLSPLEDMEPIAYVSDPETYEILWSNRSFRETWGGEVQGRRCHDVLARRDEPCALCSHEKILGPNLGQPYTWDHMVPLTGRWYRSTDKAIRWFDGRWVRLSIATDIDDTVHALSRLDRANDRLRVATASAGLGVWEWVVSTGELFWDENLHDLYGITPDDFHGRFEDWAEHCHPDDLSRVETELAAAMAARTTFRTTFRIIRADDGRVRDLDAYGIPVVDEDTGEVERLLGVSQDITARQDVAREREAALRDLERSNRELEQFAYVASHDLQEPLRMVASYTQLLAERLGDEMDDTSRMYVDYAVDGATRMQLLIKDLLTFSRVVRQAESFEEFDLLDVVNQSLHDLGPRIEESGAVVEVGPLPRIVADRARIAQLVQNLVSNALKFHDEGKTPRVEIQGEVVDDGWAFRVTDDGIGIDPRYEDTVFRIFDRLHGRDRFPGTGIGLAICRRVVELHGGRIWFTSELDRGTTFHVHLPVRTPSTPPQNEEVHP